MLGGGAVKSTGGNLLPSVVGVASCNQLIELSPTCAAKAKAQPCPAGSRVELEGMLALQMELMSEIFFFLMCCYMYVLKCLNMLGFCVFV